jgi:hypothetical protein
VPYASGAIARQGQHQVIFANNLNSAGAIDQMTPDAKRLRSNILGLAYYDRASGQPPAGSGHQLGRGAAGARQSLRSGGTRQPPFKSAGAAAI